MFIWFKKYHAQSLSFFVCLFVFFFSSFHALSTHIPFIFYSDGIYVAALCCIERFSFECRKVIGFALSTRCDWLKRFAPPFHPIRSKTKANCDALACIFPRFASATCNYFEF